MGVLFEAVAPDWMGCPSTKYFDWLSEYSGLKAVILTLLAFVLSPFFFRIVERGPLSDL